MAYDVCHAKFSYEMYECSHPWCMTRYSTTLLFLYFPIYWQRYAFLVNLSNDAWLTKAWSMEAVNSMKTEQVMNTYIIKICMISHLQCLAKHSEMILQQSCFCLCSHQSRRWVVCTGKRSRENKADCCCVAFLVLVTCLSWKNTSFVMTKICLLWQNFCCNKIMFVATNTYCLSLVMKKHIFCHDKNMLVMPKHLLQQNYVCCDKHMFVMTKHLLQQIFVATNIILLQQKWYLWQFLPVIVKTSCVYLYCISNIVCCVSASVIGTRLHIPVALTCVLMGVYVLLLKWSTPVPMPAVSSTHHFT